MDKRVDTVLSISGANRTELETVLKHYKHELQKLKVAKFLIANMRYHRSYYSIRNPRQHPLLDSLTGVADSLLFCSVSLADDSLYTEKARKMINEVRVGFRKKQGEKVAEQPVRILRKDGYDLHWVKARQLISHIDHIFEFITVP